MGHPGGRAIAGRGQREARRVRPLPPGRGKHRPLCGPYRPADRRRTGVRRGGVCPTADDRAERRPGREGPRKGGRGGPGRFPGRGDGRPGDQYAPTSDLHDHPQSVEEGDPRGVARRCGARGGPARAERGGRARRRPRDPAETGDDLGGLPGRGGRPPAGRAARRGSGPVTAEVILCYSEDDAVAEGLVRLARSLTPDVASRVRAVVLPGASPEAADRLVAAGAHAVDTVAGAGSSDPHVRAEMLRAAVAELSPTLLLVGSTKRGREVAGRLAGALDWPAATGVTTVRVRLRHEGGHGAPWRCRFPSRVPEAGIARCAVGSD